MSVPDDILPYPWFGHPEPERRGPPPVPPKVRDALARGHLAPPAARPQPLATPLTARLAAGALALTAALAVNAFALYGLFTQPQLPKGHDVRPHQLNTLAYAVCFEQGAWWPRWLPDYSGGYGAPNPLFYAPLPFHLSGRLHQLGLPLDDALRIPAALAMVASFCGMFVWALRVHRGRARRAGEPAASAWPFALVAATLYLLAPYHLFDLYGRFAYPELLAMALAPWLFWLIERAGPTGDRRGAVLLGAGVALLWLTHNLSVILFAGLGAARLVALAWRERSPAPLKLGALAGLVAAGLAAFAWVPLLVEARQTRIAVDRSMQEGWRIHLLAPAELLDNHWPGTRGHLPAYPGRLHLALGLLGLAALAGLARRRGARRSAEPLFAAAVLAHLVLVATPSELLWERSPLPAVQFPWRFLAPASLGLALVGAFALAALERWPRARAAAAFALVALIAAAYAPMVASGAHREAPPTRDGLRARYETGDFEDKYLPLGARMPARLDAPLFAVAHGEASLAVLERGPHAHRVRVRARTPVTLEVRQYAYPGWYATVDGRAVPLEREEALGAMRVRVPAGDHELRVAFGFTPVRLWTLWLSVAVAALALLAAATPRAMFAVPVVTSSRARSSRAAGDSLVPRTPGCCWALRAWPRLVAASLAWATLAGALAGTLRELAPHVMPGSDLAALERARGALLAHRPAEARAHLGGVDPRGPYAPWAAELRRRLTENGVHARWFSDDGFRRRLAERVEACLCFDTRSEPHHVPARAPISALFTARLALPVSGRWGLAVESDDGSELFLGAGAPVVSNAGQHPVRWREGHLYLAAGSHDLAVLYANAVGRGVLHVWWRPPGQPWSPVPATALRPARLPWADRLVALRAGIARRL